MSKKKFILLITFLVFFSQIYGENTRVFLKENFILEDDPERYFFKNPGDPILSENGHLIIRDGEQILLFSPERRFITNMCRIGEGPGEIKGLAGIWPGKDHIYVFSESPGKMILFNYQGDFIREIFLGKNLHTSIFLTHFRNKFYFTEEGYRNTQKGIAVMDTTVKLFSFELQGNFTGYNKIRFPKKYYMGPQTVMNLHFIQFSSTGNGIFYLANNGDYELKCFDLVKDEIKTLFKKDHPPRRIKHEWRKYTHPQTYRTRKKFIRNVLDAILRIRAVNDRIWLFTSDFNENNVIKVDVYDSGPVYRGSLDFPLPDGVHPVNFSWHSLTFSGDDILIFTPNEEGGLKLVSYRICNIPPWAE